MKKLLLIASMLLVCVASAFAEPAKADVSRPSASSVSVGVDNGSFTTIYIQDNRSFKPGIAWSRSIAPSSPNVWEQRAVFNWVVTYDTNNVAMAAGPMIGWRVLDTDYFKLMPMVGVSQDCTSGGRTNFVYGVSASLSWDKGAVTTASASMTSRARAMSVSNRKNLGGFSLFTGYGERSGAAVGAGYTWGLTDVFGITPVLACQMPSNGRGVGVGLGLGASYQFYADSRNSVSAWGGALYNTTRDNVTPAVGVHWSCW